MLKIIECQKGRSKITALKALQDNLIVYSTQSHGIRIFSLNDCKSRQILSIALLGYKTTAIDFHPTQNICAFANDKVIYVVSLSNKSILQTIYTHNGTIEILSFIKNMPYIITGTKEGRVMLYRYDGHSGISRLTSFLHVKEKHGAISNYVSAFGVYNHLLASSGFGCCVTIVNLNSYSNKKKICDSKVRVNSLCFIDESKLLYANINGTLFIQSLKSGKKAQTIQMPFSNIKDILHFVNSDYVVVSGESNSIALINIQTKKIVRAKYISFEDEVDKMILTNEQNLIVVLGNKQILHVILPTTHDLQNCIHNKNLAEAFNIINDEPRLHDTQEYKKVELLYEKLYSKAMQALINSNKKELKAIIELLLKVDTKSQDINLLYQAYEQYPRFKTFYLEKQYALAYNLSEKFPALKYTSQYKKMQEMFKEAYTFAQKQILLGRKDIAKDTLSPYVSVFSKRDVINLLLKQNKEFLQFLKALQKKDYATINTLIQKYKTFKDIPNYTTLIESEQELLKKIDSLIDNAKIEEAISYIKKMQNSTCKENELKDLYNKALSAKELLNTYEKNDFKKCYELIDSNETIAKLELVTLLQNHWQKLMNKCESYALQGDVKSIKETLQGLIRVKTRTQRIGDLLRVSFQTKIKQLISQKKIKSAENIIYSYIDIFGIDKELTLIMKSYEKYSSHKLAITLEREKYVARDGWLNSEILMNS